MKLYDLKSKEIKEVEESKSLNFLYNNLFGRIILKLLITKFVAELSRVYMNSRFSKYRIKKFIKENNINVDEYLDIEYKSFNEFFMRKIKPGKRKIQKGLFSICDSKLSVYKISEELELNIKNSVYTIDELIGSDGSNFKNGYAFVYRLAVDDYHHYVFPSNGKIISNKKIDGILHTVQPIALKKSKVFSENSREVTILDTEDYGTVAYIEVGAMMIGRIANDNKMVFKRGEEKGHFEFGGSTIVLLFEENKVNVNDIILNNTENDIETIVKLGNSLE